MKATQLARGWPTWPVLSHLRSRHQGLAKHDPLVQIWLAACLRKYNLIGTLPWFFIYILPMAALELQQN